MAKPELMTQPTKTNSRRSPRLCNSPCPNSRTHLILTHLLLGWPKTLHSVKVSWLVVSTHLKNISQIWIISPGMGKNKKYLKPPGSNGLPLKIGLNAPKGSRIIFQPSVFRGEQFAVSFREGKIVRFFPRTHVNQWLVNIYSIVGG